MTQDNNGGVTMKGDIRARQDKCLEIWLDNPTIPLDTVADMAGVGRKTFWRYRKDENFMARYHEEQKKRFAALEGKAVALLDKQMEDGNWSAIKYVLDGNGYKPADKVDMNASTTISISIDEE